MLPSLGFSVGRKGGRANHFERLGRECRASGASVQ